MGLDFLKKVNLGQKPKVGKHVVVIGCGNSGMDTVVGAYQMGAESVVAIDVQQPAAFKKEIRHVEELGGKLVWPFMTTRITDEGIYADDGRFIPADQVIVSIGEEPVLDFLPDQTRQLVLQQLANRANFRPHRFQFTIFDNLCRGLFMY